MTASTDLAARRLAERMAELDDLLGRLGRDDEAIRADRVDVPADDEHDPEGSTLSMEWQRIDALRRATLIERAQLDAALARVEEGTYGICTRCGRRIPAGRLQARPAASMCVDCAAQVGS